MNIVISVLAAEGSENSAVYAVLFPWAVSYAISCYNILDLQCTDDQDMLDGKYCVSLSTGVSNSTGDISALCDEHNMDVFVPTYDLHDQLFDYLLSKSKFH